MLLAKNCNLPILAVSGKDVDPKFMFNLREHGVADFVSKKTLSLADFRRRIETLVHNPLGESKLQNPSVFISYSHEDRDFADMLLKVLDKNGIHVVIDSKSMLPGKNIQDFIVESINKTDITLSIISKNSLLSSWVAMEAINTFNSQNLGLLKTFIPCNIDNDFFDSDFTDKVSNILDEKINSINSILQDRISNNRGIRDFQNEIDRYRELRHNIDSNSRNRLRVASALVILSGLS